VGFIFDIIGIMKDYYKILGISPDTSDDDTKRAYRDLAKKYHPDINKSPEAEAKFKEISEAYDAIKSGWKPGQSRGNPLPNGFQFGGNNPFDFFFENNPLFKNAREVYFSPDIELFIELDFLDACHGAERPLKYSVKESCKECDRFHSLHGRFDSKKCEDCNGLGKTIQRNAFMSLTVTCKKCHGVGAVNACVKCSGRNYEDVDRTITIKIPEGIDSNSKLRVTGAGNYFVQEKRRGDLYLNINIRPHAVFKRKNIDIFTEIDVDYLDCLLGVKKEVETIHGKQEIEIPDLSENKRIIVLKNLGIKKNGSHYLTINMTIPKSLNKKERKMLENIKNARKNDII
jgi:molecular chaperone DnaJ